MYFEEEGDPATCACRKLRPQVKAPAPVLIARNGPGSLVRHRRASSDPLACRPGSTAGSKWAARPPDHKPASEEVMPLLALDHGGRRGHHRREASEAARDRLVPSRGRWASQVRAAGGTTQPVDGHLRADRGPRVRRGRLAQPGTRGSSPPALGAPAQPRQHRRPAGDTREHSTDRCRLDAGPDGRLPRFRQAETEHGDARCGGGQATITCAWSNAM